MMRKEGKTDEQIADSILTAMGSHSGYKHGLARKKMIITLSEFIMTQVTRGLICTNLFFQ